MSRRAWVLNLDAEEELAGRRPYKGPFAALAARPELLAALAPLVPQGDVVLLGDGEPSPDVAGLQGRAWCPTRSALDALSRRGAVGPRAPAMAILRRVASRAFSASLGLHLPGARFFTGPSELDLALGSLVGAGPVLARRSFGFAGRGRRLLAGSAPTEVEAGFIRRALAEGGLLLEPFVERSADFSLHGHVDRDEIVLGEVVKAQVDRAGVWRGSRLATEDELARAERSALFEEATRSAVALRSAGYFGPFGLDAYRYTLRGAEGWNPRCEINARYSMAWAIGMGERRPDL